MSADWPTPAESLHVRAYQKHLGVLVDGIDGPRTMDALKQAGRAGRVTVAAQPAVPPAQWPTQADVERVFGKPGGEDCTAGRCDLPFPFVLAWDESQKVQRVACHRLVAEAFTAVWAEAAAHYGEAEFRLLRLDRFGGCYNFRNVRGGTTLSMHSWGIAWDVDPIRNQLRWRKDRAQLAQPRYEPFWRIVEARGLVSLGRQRDFDWQHFQAARLS